MKRGFIFLLIILLITENVNAYSFSDFVNDVRNVREYIYDFITGQPVAGGEPEGQPDPESGATGAGDYDVGGGGDIPGPESCPISGCSVFLEGVYSVGGENVVMAVPWIINELKSCSDGTLYGECSTSAPKFCDNGELVNDCKVCGCSPGYGQCNEDGTCEIVSKCEDAGGICDTNCGRDFEHIATLDKSCSPVRLGEDVRSIITISGMAVSNEVECCIPFIEANFTNKTYLDFIEKEWLNITTKRKITEIDTFKDICVDKSEYGKCSPIRPLYCYEGHLYNFCSKCGCEKGQICDIFTNICIDEDIAKKKIIFSRFSQLSESEDSIITDFLYNAYQGDKLPVEINVNRVGNTMRIIVGDVILHAGLDSYGKPSLNFGFPSPTSERSISKLEEEMWEGEQISSEKQQESPRKEGSGLQLVLEVLIPEEYKIIKAGDDIVGYINITNKVNSTKASVLYSIINEDEEVISSRERTINLIPGENIFKEEFTTSGALPQGNYSFYARVDHESGSYLGRDTFKIAPSSRIQTSNIGRTYGTIIILLALIISSLYLIRDKLSKLREIRKYVIKGKEVKASRKKLIIPFERINRLLTSITQLIKNKILKLKKLGIRKRREKLLPKEKEEKKLLKERIKDILKRAKGLRISGGLARNVLKRVKKLDDKKKLVEISKEKLIEMTLTRLRKLRLQIDKKYSSNMIEAYFDIIRFFFSNFYSIRYKFTFQELIKELNKREVKDRKEIIKFLEQISYVPYYKIPVSKEKFNKIIEDAIVIIKDYQKRFVKQKDKFTKKIGAAKEETIEEKEEVKKRAGERKS